MILGQLAGCPKHGYIIARIIGDVIGPFRKVQWGALYPVLGRLESDGLIRAEESGDGRRKVYALTDAGWARLHDLLLDTEHHLAEYDAVFRLKVTYFSYLTVDERLYLARHYAIYAQQNIDHLQRESRDLVERSSNLAPDLLKNVLAVMDHRITYWREERAWAEALITENHGAKEAS